MNSPYLSVVIPAYDEMANLQKGVLEKVAYFLHKKKIVYEVLVVDDGSTDGSIEFVERFCKENSKFKLIKNPHMGKAGAVTTGMLASKGKYVLFTDMDQATPIEEVDKLLPYLEKKFDIAIGARSSVRKGSPAIRQFISWCSIVLRKMIVGLDDLSDTQCGFKLFTQEASKKVFTRIRDIHHGFSRVTGSSVTSGFDVELLLVARKMGYKIKEAPVTWLYVETRRVSPIKDSIDGVAELLKIRLNEVRGVYKNS